MKPCTSINWFLDFVITFRVSQNPSLALMIWHQILGQPYLSLLMKAFCSLVLSCLASSACLRRLSSLCSRPNTSRQNSYSVRRIFVGWRWFSHLSDIWTDGVWVLHPCIWEWKKLRCEIWSHLLCSPCYIWIYISFVCIMHTIEFEWMIQWW